MSNGEFKKENQLKIKVTHEKKGNSTKDNPLSKGKSNGILLSLLLINLIMLAVIVYLGINQYLINTDLKEDINKIKEKVNDLTGLNANMEKLNTNFQILDIINSNTRQIPDILLSIEENKKILKNIDHSEMKNPSIKVDFTDEFKNLEEKIKEYIKSEFKSNTGTFSIEDIKSEIKNMRGDIENIKSNISNLNLSLSVEKEDENVMDILKNNERTVLKNIDEVKNIISENYDKIDKKYNALNLKIADLNKRMDSLNYNEYLFNLKNELKNLNEKISYMDNDLNKSQEEYYKKIEALINKRDILDMIKKLNEYISKGEDFKLIEMVSLYKDIVLRYDVLLDKDEKVKEDFENITRNVYVKFLDIINMEINYLKKTRYSTNIKKDIRYISYVFSQLPKVDINKYNQIEKALSNLKNLEEIKIQEYNNAAVYSINKYLKLFSKKSVLEEEIINSFKNNILTIEPGLLEEKNKELYFNVVGRTKEILKEKYIW